MGFSKIRFVQIQAEHVQTVRARVLATCERAAPALARASANGFRIWDKVWESTCDILCYPVRSWTVCAGWRALEGARMADTPQLTTDQYNFCRAVEAMRLDLLRSGKEAAWLVAHPGVVELVWGQIDGYLCGLRVMESEASPPGSFYLTHRRPDGAGSEHR
jgi:hypothetical protein